MHACRSHWLGNPIPGYLQRRIFIESTEKLVYSSLVKLPCQEAVKVEAWSKSMQKMKEDCLADGYVSSLSEEVHVELKQNDLKELAKLWE